MLHSIGWVPSVFIIRRFHYKITSKKGQPLYKGQKDGSQVCPTNQPISYSYCMYLAPEERRLLHVPGGTLLRVPEEEGAEEGGRLEEVEVGGTVEGGGRVEEVEVRGTEVGGTVEEVEVGGTEVVGRVEGVEVGRTEVGGTV